MATAESSERPALPEHLQSEVLEMRSASRGGRDEAALYPTKK